MPTPGPRVSDTSAEQAGPAGPGLNGRRAAFLIAALVLLVFSPALSAGFVYDSRIQILTDDFIHDPGNWPSVLSFQVLSRDVLDFNRPVQLASLMLDAAIWGREPFGYHLTSVLLHAANAVLVGALAARLLGPGAPRLVSVVAALLFALHPIVVEAVCEPTYREDLLALFFSLAAVLLALRHAPDGSGADPLRAIACAGCCLLAVASKETGAVAPALVAVTWRLFRRDDPAVFWRLTLGLACVAVAAFLAARFAFEPRQSAIFEAKPTYPGGTLASTLLLQPRILALYAQLVAFPVNLCADYGAHSIRHLPLAVSCVVLGALVVAAISAWRHDRRMIIACAMIVLPLLPVMNLIPIYRAAADRYLYGPMAGVALAVACLLDAPWLRGNARGGRAALAGCLVVCAVLGCAAMQRQGVWHDRLALWQDAARRNPAAFTPQSGLSGVFLEAGRLVEAEAATRQALRLCDGKHGDTWATLALVLDGQGRTEEAAAALSRALEVDPRLADPPARVAALAMERDVATALADLLGRLGPAADGKRR